MVEMARSLPLFVAIGTVAERSESLHDCEVGLEFDQEWADLGIKSNVRGKPALDEADFKERIPKAQLRFMGRNTKYGGLPGEPARRTRASAPSSARGAPPSPTSWRPSPSSRTAAAGRTRSARSASRAPFDKTGFTCE